jgi:hypothetical protein
MPIDGEKKQMYTYGIGFFDILQTVLADGRNRNNSPSAIFPSLRRRVRNGGSETRPVGFLISRRHQTVTGKDVRDFFFPLGGISFSFPSLFSLLVSSLSFSETHHHGGQHENQLRHQN